MTINGMIVICICDKCDKGFKWPNWAQRCAGSVMGYQMPGSKGMVVGVTFGTVIILVIRGVGLVVFVVAVKRAKR